jgi:hypothetical protein
MRVLSLSIVALLVLPAAVPAGPDTITYQGSVLDSSGKAIADGTYRMQFKLYDAQSGGTKHWQQTSNVEVDGGLFSVTLGDSRSLHPVFMACPDLWLEVTVDADQSGTFAASEVYSPRQNLTGSPWACPRVEPNDKGPNMIAGHASNATSPGVVAATIAGGGTSVQSGPNITMRPNRVTDDGGTVGGGVLNVAGDSAGTADDADHATVGGGLENEASGPRATVAGGYKNVADGITATVAGGRENKAGGMYAVAVGGRRNDAAGAYGFAAGLDAKARHNGAFVWADSSGFEFASTSFDQFNVRATGGVRIVSAIDGSGSPAAGVVLSAGAGSWSSLSDRYFKENVRSVDGYGVLMKLVDVPIATWNYKAQSDSIRHMGPMSQDFRAAFGLGDSDKAIATIDADGISLAAIQGLYQVIQEKDAEIELLKQQNVDMLARLESIETRLATVADSQRAE